jgi:hypothetical protein
LSLVTACDVQKAILLANGAEAQNELDQEWLDEFAEGVACLIVFNSVLEQDDFSSNRHLLSIYALSRL